MGIIRLKHVIKWCMDGRINRTSTSVKLPHVCRIMMLVHLEIFSLEY